MKKLFAIQPQASLSPTQSSGQNEIFSKYHEQTITLVSNPKIWNNPEKLREVYAVVTEPNPDMNPLSALEKESLMIVINNRINTLEMANLPEQKVQELSNHIGGGIINPDKFKQLEDFIIQLKEALPQIGKTLWEHSENQFFINIAARKLRADCLEILIKHGVNPFALLNNLWPINEVLERHTADWLNSTERAPDKFETIKTVYNLLSAYMKKFIDDPRINTEDNPFIKSYTSTDNPLSFFLFSNKPSLYQASRVPELLELGASPYVKCEAGYWPIEWIEDKSSPEFALLKVAMQDPKWPQYHDHKIKAEVDNL